MLQFKSVKTSPRVAEIWVEFDSSVKISQEYFD